VAGECVADLCAGIGTLAFAYTHFRCYARTARMVCVEINPAYVDVGRKVLPEATWICAGVFEVWRDLGRFDCAIANPPFGARKTGSRGPRYAGAKFEYQVLDIASQIADHGVFILPQGSAGFRYSGAQYYERNENNAYRKFTQDTGLTLEAGCGVDTTVYRGAWKDVSPLVEIVCCDFAQRERRCEAPQQDRKSVV